MEHLVHLRLKSIYKAFKGSTNKGQAFLQAAADAARKESSPEPKKEHLEALEAKADQAAAELLAQLDQEEEAVNSKKRKKKSKKDKKRKGKGEDEPPPQQETSLDVVPPSPESDTPVTETAEAPPIPAVEPEDPLELKLSELVVDEDMDGLEELLASIKGVPGRAALRKNTKKALKRLRAKQEEEFIPTSSGKTEAPVVADSTENQEQLLPPTEPLPEGISLKVVRYQHNILPTLNHKTRNPAAAAAANTTLKSECILWMSPHIVGWVIGKGGQRIRDLMDQSGARIWIDQETMAAHLPRVVYVSGNTSQIDEAVEQIRELIARAATQPEPAAAAPISARKAGIHRHSQVISCDQRFVPLLIGRRGWTIKNIQDSSGARVDIDQNVDPPKVTLSGSEAQVEVAHRMVQDVLNYPQAQLIGKLEDEHSPSVPTSPSAVEIPETTTAPHSPPPAALIMANNAKDSISEASSLSTTPEPSSLKMSVSHPAPQMSLPPTAGSPLLPPRSTLNDPSESSALFNGEPAPIGGQPLSFSGLPSQDHQALAQPPAPIEQPRSGLNFENDIGVLPSPQQPLVQPRLQDQSQRPDSMWGLAGEQHHRPPNDNFLSTPAAMEFLRANNQKEPESDVVNSLFRGLGLDDDPSGGGMLQSLQGISENQNHIQNTSSLGLWSAGGVGGGGLGSLPMNDERKDHSLFSSNQHAHQHPPEQSRFGWGTGHM